MSISKFSILNPYYATLDIDVLTSIHIKNIKGIISDKEPVFRRGRKVLKRWYTSKEDRLLNKPAFCKTYKYNFSSSGELTIITKCQWFDSNDNVLEERSFFDEHSVQSTDYQTQKHREALVSLLRSDAKGIKGVNGKGDAVKIFKRYKNQIQDYIFDQNASVDWVEALNNEAKANILNFLNVELPTVWVDNIYEKALDAKTLILEVISQENILPFKEDFSPKTQTEIAVELLGRGIDITNPDEALSNMVSYLISKGLDVRVLTIKDVIIELITTK